MATLLSATDGLEELYELLAELREQNQTLVNLYRQSEIERARMRTQLLQMQAVMAEFIRLASAAEAYAISSMQRMR